MIYREFKDWRLITPNNPKDNNECYEVTCSDRRKSLPGPGIAYQAINLKSPDVRLCNWSTVQKRATIDVLVFLTNLDSWDVEELKEPKMRKVRNDLPKNPFSKR